MAGVNRAAVAVTDTFDVWRVRTNELNTSLNAGTHAKTADTIVWRDDDASLIANVVTANTLTMTHQTGTATLVVTSALAADATKASIQTTGGIKADLGSKFGAAVDVTGALTVGGNTTLGNAAGTDTVTFTSRVGSAIDNTTSITYDVGSSTRLWKNYYGQGIKLTGNTTFAADASLDIASGHATKPSLKITDAVQAGTSAKLVDITSNSADTAVRPLFKVTNDNVAAVNTTAICAQADSGRGFYAISTDSTQSRQALPALEIVSNHTTGNTATKNTATLITASALTSGSALNVQSASNARTGHLVHIESTSTNAGSTGDTLHVQNDTTANTVMIANFANSTTNVVSIAVGGAVTIDGDLEVTGSTSQFRSSSSVVNDKTLVLGTAGDVNANNAYTAATPPVVTSTAHGLVTDNVIFIVSRSGDGIPAANSETVFKVTRIDANSFSLKSIAGTSHNATAGAGFISWTGNQTDSIVDDAGLYIPGAQDVHKLKWDNDDKYWEFNDSLKVDTATQFVLPKGTTAQQPAAAIAVVNNKSVAAAITGAMRYNTDNSYFEGVNAGTTFEAFATQNFSTAIAVALG